MAPWGQTGEGDRGDGVHPSWGGHAQHGGGSLPWCTLPGYHQHLLGNAGTGWHAARWPLPWHGRCQASPHGGDGAVPVPSPAAGRDGDAQREAWERRDLYAPASAQPDSPRAAGQAAPRPFGTADGYPRPRGETPKATEPLSAGRGREGLRGVGVLRSPQDPCAGVPGLRAAAPCVAHRGCAGQGGAGARGERARMETCRPLTADLLHKQKICQSREKCEGRRSRQHVVWAGGT